MEVPDSSETQASEEQSIQRWKDLFTIIGSVAGIAALLWNVYWGVSNAQNSYLQLTLDVHSAATAGAAALTTVENKGEFSKTIDYAALVISPAGMDIRKVVDDLRRCSGEATPINISAEPVFTVLAYLPAPDTPLYCEGELSIIPLTFFYKEQTKIGNEKLSSHNLIDVKAFHHPANPGSAYDVRFIVRGEGRTRSTLDLLLLRN